MKRLEEEEGELLRLEAAEELRMELLAASRSAPGLATPKCSGLCVRGYYCPAGSTSATEVPCPAGRYGDVAGLGSPLCSGACPKTRNCPLATVDPFSRPILTYA